MTLWRSSWHTSQHHRRSFWSALVLFTIFATLPALVGVVLAQAFGALEEGRGRRVVTLAALLLMIEGCRIVALQHGVLWFTRSWEYCRALLRYNMLDAQLVSGGPRAGKPMTSAGQAIARFRDDTEDLSIFIDTWIDVTAGLVFTVISLTILATVDPLATVVMVVPMAVVGAVTALLGSRLRNAHRIDRAATAAVTGFLGDLMGAAITVKVNNAEAPLLREFRLLVDRRRRTAVRVRLYSYAIRSFSQSTAEIGLGLVILVSLGAVADGRLGVAELVLLLAYGGWLGFLPRMIGLLVARGNQATVALANMATLVADGDPANAAAPRAIQYPEGRPPDVFHRRELARVPLQRLDVEGLTLRLGSGGVSDVSFTLERGSFTVITGPVGAGKTTLLRALLGLVGRGEVEGSVRWNGEEIDDRAAFLVPPNAAYLSQVPQLVSDSLRDNVLLGGPESALGPALAIAAVEADVARMPAGVETTIGPRGVRLSGGQRQRVAAARALVHRPELLVLDDVSSALDVETELALWHNLAEAGITVLAVSHRQVAHFRADQVLTLHNGRVTRS